MNKTFLLGVLVGFTLTAAIAGPFNPVTTASGTNAFVDRFCVTRDRLIDGGQPLYVDFWLSVPVGTTLPDAGVDANVDVKSGRFNEVRSAAITAMTNYLDGALLSGARAQRQMEQ